jgi:diguanylate cyclase (GGDEF)-like protein
MAETLAIFYAFGGAAGLCVSAGVEPGIHRTILVALGVVIRRLVIRASSASRDPLTGLSNRRGFDDALAELMAEASRTGEPLSAVLLDLDHFKAINDTHGHEAGDRMLCRVSDVWQQELPDGAVLARHGGDEFSILLPRATGDAALALVRRVCSQHPDLALSCGVAAHHPGETASQLMRRADRALYEAKSAGRGRAALDDELDAVAQPT